MKINTFTFFASSLLLMSSSYDASAERVPAAEGKFQPTWESVSAHETPEWFRDAKFGIWAHWGPQCQPEAGDWYARGMYEQGSHAYCKHIELYGHPSEFGFMDVINQWKADNWDPERLVALYKRAGAQYFFAMGNHHDNLDLWNSRHHRWNSVNVGPHRDILAGWEKAARANGLPFGVSIHSSHAWTWYEPAQGADKDGKYAGLSYDARLLKASDGKGRWWDGLDPQELYQQNHALSVRGKDVWDWPEGVAVPTREYYDDFFNRTVDMIDSYNPDLIYFDDTVLPFWPIDNTGLDVVAHFYNSNMNRNNGRSTAVVFGKKLEDSHKQAIVWDVEKGILPDCQSLPWQTCTCLGNWHYDRGLYERDGYKSAATVIRMLVDIVSKNGNMLLSVPVRADGTIDEKEEKILGDIAAWMDVNSEGLFGTRPWTVFGEGPSVENAAPIERQGFNEGKSVFTSEDIRYVVKNGVLYAHVLAWPADGHVLLRTLASDNSAFDKKIKSVELLGGGKLKFSRTTEGLAVNLPERKKTNEISLVLKIR
jgi:alpha-L-fucosidase